MSDFDTVHAALMLLDGQPHDEMEVHEAWLNGLAAAEAMERVVEAAKEVLNAWADGPPPHRATWNPAFSALRSALAALHEGEGPDKPDE